MALSRLGKFCDKRSLDMDKEYNFLGAQPEESQFQQLYSKKKIEDSQDTPQIFPYFQSMKREFEVEERKLNYEQKSIKTQKQFNGLFPIKMKQAQGSSPIFKVVQRKPPDYFPKGEKRPFVGLYSPHYVFLQHSSPKWDFGSPSKNTTILEGVKRNKMNSALNQSSGFEKPLYGIPPGPISFGNQVSRPSITKLNSCNPHESRFNYFDKTPPISTLNNRVSQIDFGKGMRRGPECFATSMTNLSYEPKYGPKDKKVPKGQVKFDKMPKRNIEFSNKLPYVKDSINPEKVSNFIHFMHTTPTLANLSKPKENRNNNLPRYLTGLNNRMGMTVINSDSLKATNFKESVYLHASQESTSPKKSPSPNKTESKGFSFEDSMIKGNNMLNKLQHHYINKTLSESLILN